MCRANYKTSFLTLPTALGRISSSQNLRYLNRMRKSFRLPAPPCREVLIQYALNSFTAARPISCLFAGLIYQRLMAFHTVAQLFQPVTELVAILRLILDLIAKLVTE